jgi:hypothetical protein
LSLQGTGFSLALRYCFTLTERQPNRGMAKQSSLAALLRTCYITHRNWPVLQTTRQRPHSIILMLTSQVKSGRVRRSVRSLLN